MAAVLNYQKLCNRTKRKIVTAVALAAHAFRDALFATKSAERHAVLINVRNPPFGDI
jgi:hypothetical protein